MLKSHFQERKKTTLRPRFKSALIYPIRGLLPIFPTRMAASKMNTIIARSFSSSASRLQMVKPPIQVFGLEGRYATALYSAASKQSSLPAVEKDLIGFQGLMKTNVDLAEFIKNPSIKRSSKAATFKAIGAKISLNSATTNLLEVMAENGRLDKLDHVINAFKLIMAANRGEVVCQVTSAKPLDADTKSKLESTLKGFLSQGQTILLTTKVDPAILGGLIISIGDKYVDMSIASKVKMYSNIISSV